MNKKRLLPLTSSQLIKKLEQVGFRLIRQKGSHARFIHDDGRRVTIPIHPGRTIPKGTIKAILKQAEII